MAYHLWEEPKTCGGVLGCWLGHPKTSALDPGILLPIRSRRSELELQKAADHCFVNCRGWIVHTIKEALWLYTFVSKIQGEPWFTVITRGPFCCWRTTSSTPEWNTWIFATISSMRQFRTEMFPSFMPWQTRIQWIYSQSYWQISNFIDSLSCWACSELRQRKEGDQGVTITITNWYTPHDMWHSMNRPRSVISDCQTR